MHKWRRQLRYLLFLSSSLLVVVPGLAADTAQDFRIATEGYRYSFPRDHGSHEEFRTEWWYYTGQVTAKDGRPFGYQLTFFRRGMPRDQTKTLPSQWAVTQLYLAHFAVSDLSKGRFHFAEKISRAGLGKAGAGAPNRHRPLLAHRPSRQRMATWLSNSRSRRKNHLSCMAPMVSAAKEQV
jgi:predicted secreted hydrolase